VATFFLESFSDIIGSKVIICEQRNIGVRCALSSVLVLFMMFNNNSKLKRIKILIKIKIETFPIS